VCFTDSAEGETMGVHKETNGTKTVFLTFDQLCLDTWALPSYTTTDGYHWTEPNVHSVVGASLNWFGLGTSVDDNNLPTIAAEYSLQQNYPNPFNPETVINYSISQPGLVKLAVYNVLGQKVAELVNEHQTANSYKVTFDANNLTSGVYFYNLEVGDYSKTMKMMLLR
ncbi:MAG TPA: T9SS type A sorting domain-containing protein, partial [bacterium]|nr:T9SS type A sorting domain-containing protein [bacterium]